MLTKGISDGRSRYHRYQTAAQINPDIHIPSTAMSLPIGIIMMLFGGGLTVGAAWHFRMIRRSIMKGEIRSSGPLVVIITLGVTFVTVLMILYLLMAAANL